jgi:hypothetical protein
MKKLSFFAQFSDALIVGFLCILVPAMFSFGYYYGLSYVDKEIVEVRIQNKDMRDSIDMYRNREIAWRQSINNQVEPASTLVAK